MPSWTPQHSLVLSLLLDEVVGTQKAISIRKDFCKIYDCLSSSLCPIYFTGSKAEGLDLPGSDEDCMHDINYMFRITVTQSLREMTPSSTDTILFVETENIQSGFALLQFVNEIKDPILLLASQFIRGRRYLSSNLFLDVQTSRPTYWLDTTSFVRQGPSIEMWTEYGNKSSSGMDNVLSIHCQFWPNSASEWIHRSRPFGWPNSCDISSIIDFGCHLVPIGFPLSHFKFIEWRISFSIAEKILVGSFSHVQMQCYAVMKIILKEFIKVRCSSKNYVLCSYFIKTFLFWKFETTDGNFWRADNLRECIKSLLSCFCSCIQEGSLKHYFFPKFNLLSVKLTRAAQRESCCRY